MKPAASSPRKRTFSVGLLLSLLVHAGGFGLLLLLPRPVPLAQLPENSIEVEFVDEPPRPSSPPPTAPEATRREVPTPPASAALSGQPPPPHAAEPAPPAMIQARNILSAVALADPRSREARKALPLLGRNERMEQLCNVEAMAQLRAWNRTLQPDLTIAYALAETKIDAASVRADGAAFRSRRQWFTLKYHCELTGDLAKITAFEFQAGAAIPKRDWNRYGLPDDEGPQD